MKYKKNSNFPAPVIILVRPQMAENVGMVARAMMNCGLSELRLVAPRENHLSQQALSAASGAQVILKEAKVYKNLDEVVSDLNYVMATTARVRGMNKEVFTPNEAVEIIGKKINANQKVGLLFGPERTGLENSDITLADSLLTIPLNPTHPSLNLAQAVLLTGWIWWQNNLTSEKKNAVKSLPAPKKELNLFFNFLIQHLEDKNYFRLKDKKERMLQNLKNIFIKSSLTSTEIRTLYRVVKYLTTPFQKQK